MGEWNAIGQAGGERMAFEMIDGDERFAGGQRDRLRGGQADDDAADEAGPGGRGDGVDVGEAEPRIAERRGDYAVERLDMGAGGDLGNDTAEDGMSVGLR